MYAHLSRTLDEAVLRSRTRMRLVNLFYVFTGYLAYPLTNYATDESKTTNSLIDTDLNSDKHEQEKF